MDDPGTQAPAHRPARRSDLAQIVDIYNSTVPTRLTTADTEPVSVASREHWFEAHHPHSHPLWVVEGLVENRQGIAAWLSFQPFYGRPAYRRTAEISIYVHAQCRRQGLGRHLLTHAIAHAPILGIDTLLGFIFGHNEASLTLFQGTGFQRWGLLPRIAVLDETERDLIIVGRRVEH